MVLTSESPNLGRSQLAYRTPEIETLPEMGKYACLSNSDKRLSKTENHTMANNVLVSEKFLV